MKLFTQLCSLALLLCLLFAGCTVTPIQKNQNTGTEVTKMTSESTLAAKISRFAPTEVTADASTLSENDRKALDKIIEAARYMDPIFLRQVWSGNVAMEKRLAAATSDKGKELLHNFKINVGPWDRLD